MENGASLQKKKVELIIQNCYYINVLPVSLSIWTFSTKQIYCSGKDQQHGLDTAVLVGSQAYSRPC